MMLALLIGGIGAILAGLLAILFGIPVQEFSFGNTLILTGAAGVCTGMVLLGLAAVVWELRIIARRLGPAIPAETRVRPILPPGISAAAIPAEGEGLLFGGDQAPEPAQEEVPSPPPWHDQAGARERLRPEAPPPEAAEGAAPAQRQRRNLLFASTSRKERERAEARAAEAVPPDQRPPVQPEPPQPSEAPPATFEDAWPKPERRSPEPSERRPVRAPSIFPEPGSTASSERQPPVPPKQQPPPAVTVLKSGVVDGMAYSLYSDGSIEAQMPEGMMRFASIDELRAHLDQKS
ncbi:MAG: DUF308 domain-containing protein [Bradyrhizobium sp.]|uniref:DUF308 domain-containing protein n=1 Tax=Bradyrhizobium sp. TaxID=376 RepID=UPI0025C59E59|nr:DUF308 domain-containing protein [Bradyrhizobium sp.]MBI5262531.1 DUF308 domain-containing protein [Bradyrhizobium sp.]